LAHPGKKFQIDKWHFTSNTTMFYEVRVLSKINVGTPVLLSKESRLLQQGFPFAENPVSRFTAMSAHREHDRT